VVVIFATSVSSEPTSLRSMMCVAPSALTREKFAGDANAMIGENPDSLASCTAVGRVVSKMIWIYRRDGLPYCPTEEAALKTMKGLPAYLFLPLAVHGGVNPRLWLSALYIASAGVTSPTGINAASSTEMLLGIWRRA
jgi:hypothetical protein